MSVIKQYSDRTNHLADTTVLIQVAIRVRPQTLTYLRQEARLQHASYARFIGSILDAYVQNCLEAERDDTNDAASAAVDGVENMPSHLTGTQNPPANT